MESKKITININKRATNIVLSMLIFVLVLAAFVMAKYFGSSFINFEQSGDGDQPIYKAVNNKSITSIYVILMVSALILALIKILISTKEIFVKNKESGLAISLLWIEIISVVLLLLGALSLTMHKGSFAVEESIKDIDLSIWIYKCLMPQTILSYMNLAWTFIVGALNIAICSKPIFTK